MLIWDFQVTNVFRIRLKTLASFVSGFFLVLIAHNLKHVFIVRTCGNVIL